MACKFVRAAPIVSSDSEIVRIRLDSAGDVQEFGLTPHAAVALCQQLRGSELRRIASRQLQADILNLQDSFCRPDRI